MRTARAARGGTTRAAGTSSEREGEQQEQPANSAPRSRAGQSRRALVRVGASHKECGVELCAPRGGRRHDRERWCSFSEPVLVPRGKRGTAVTSRARGA